MIHDRQIRTTLLMPLLAFLGLGTWQSLAGGEMPPVNAPHWVWIAPQAGDLQAKIPVQGITFEKEFEATFTVSKASLRVTADSCRIEVRINHHAVAGLEPFCPALTVDIAPYLRPGKNRVQVVAFPLAEAPAIAASVGLDDGKGHSADVISDGDWIASLASAGGDSTEAPPTTQLAVVSLGPVPPELWGLARRPATIDPFDNYEQWRQALGESPAESAPSFWIAPNFEITLLRTAQPEEGSWVSLAIDPQGRLTVAREDKGLLRLSLAADGRSIRQVETVNDDLLECRGLLYAHGSLYANANNSKGLYQLRDADGDDRFDEVRLLREFPGGVGHGRNDLALGPDGMIYSIHGDAVDVPAADIADFTSPFREARRGEKTSEGCLLRTDADGKKWELLSAGMRNPFGLAFHPAGGLFTYDADAEFDMGSPWYRPTRLLQLRSGADFGWRGVTGKWPPYYPDHPDNALPALDIGKGSPTAIACGAGSKFPPPYHDAVFILDWAYGRVLAVHLAPRGAGYFCQAETFLKGRPLNVTDIAFGPGGAMYLVTGGRKTQSALYKVAYVGPSATAPPTAGQHEQACALHAAAARKLLEQLESLHRSADGAAIEAAWPHLDAVDPVIRYAARLAIEHQPVAGWRDRALAEPRTTAALEALLALARSGDASSVEPMLQRLQTFRLGDLTVSQQLALLHIYSLCLDRKPAAIERLRPQIISQLDDAFAPEKPVLQVGPAGTSVHVQRELARLLARLDSPSVVAKTTATLLVSGVQEDRLQALFALRNVREGWTLDSRRAWFAALNEGGHFLGGDGMPRFLSQMREEAVATLSAGERQSLADHIAAPASAAEEELKLPQRAVVKAWTIDDFAETLTAPKGGDPARGKLVFQGALCIRCHRVGARGPAVGPDLTHVAGRFSRRDILQSILTPSQVVAEPYRNVQVRLHDGRVLVGRVVNEGDYRSEKLRMAPDPLRPSHFVEFSKRDIDQYQLASTSPMPQGLLDTFSASEILDLLAYLQAGPESAP